MLWFSKKDKSISYHLAGQKVLSILNLPGPVSNVSYTAHTVLCKSNESEIRRNTSFVLTNFQGNFERYFAIFLRKFEELSRKCCVVDRKFGKANEISMKQSFERAKYRRIFEETKGNMEISCRKINISLYQLKPTL